MSKATFTFGRFNPPTEQGHGKLVKAVQDHAESTGGTHYIFPTHTQDPKKNPMSHEQKVGAMRKLFPKANIVSHDKVRTAIDAVKHLESKGHTHVTMVVGSDRVAEFQGLLTKYRKKEFPKIKKIDVKSAGHRDPDAEGAEGMSASKLRGLVSAGKKDEFVSHYSDKKLGKQIHDTVKAGMQMESINPIGIFLLGAPGSGKDYVLNNIFSRFDLTEVQADQIVNQSANELYESKTNLVINGALDEARIAKIQDMLHEHGYTYDFVYVSVTNKVSRLRNEQRQNPIAENKRIDKFLKAEKLAAFVEAHVFNNSINLNESSEMEKVFFASEIQKLLERITALGLELKETPSAKSFVALREGTKKATGGLKNACWKGYTAIGMKTKNGRKVPNCVPVEEQIKGDLKVPHSVDSIAQKHKVSTASIIQALTIGKEVEKEHTKDEKTAETIALAHLWEKPDYYEKLKQIEQFTGDEHSKLARFNGQKTVRGLNRINRLRHHTIQHHNNNIKQLATEEVEEIDEMQLIGTDEYRKHAIAMTPGQSQTIKSALDNKVEVHDCGCESDCECNEESEIDLTPSLSVKKKATGAKPNARYNARLAGLSVVSNMAVAEDTKTAKKILSGLKVLSLENKDPSMPRQVPRHIPAGTQMIDGIPQDNVPKGWKRVKDFGGGHKLVKVEPSEKIREAVEYHLENKISFTENVFRPGSEMFFEMINEAKLLYKAGMYEPTDEWEVDMLNSDIGEKAIYEGQEVILDYPFEEDIEQIDEVFNTVYPHTYHGTLRPEDPKSENGPEHMYTFRIPGKGNLRHTYSVSINRFEGKKGSLSFGYHGKQPADFVPVGKHGDKKYFEAGEHEITGEGGGKASSIISTVKSIAQTHAKKHGLKTMVFAGSSDEPSRSKLYNRIVNRMGGKEHRSEDDEFDPYREYSVPMKEDSDPTNGKGIGKPWREGGGGAVYVRTGDGGVKKVRFSQSGMAKKFNDPARVRSFVARHRCLTNKDKTSASYWACRWPRFFSNSGKTWW
jgi:dephospho-CoA kinase